MGYSENSDINWVYHGNRGWTVPHVVGYMESHDEERMMYRNKNFGNSFSTYDITNISTGLNRVKAASAIFYTIPGPKMLWQFGELGYDYGINYCQDTGTESNECRTYPKPIRWDYRDDYSRYSLYTHISDLVRLRNEYDIFSHGTATVPSTTDLGKQIQIKNNPYTSTPTNASEMNAVVVVNFDVRGKTIFVDFPHTGTWYDYYAYGATLNVSPATMSIQLPAGGYKIFTDVEITNPIITSVDSEIEQMISIFPNPVQQTLTIESEIEVRDLKLYTIHGIIHQPGRVSENSWDVSQLHDGLYIAEVQTIYGNMKVKVVKRK
jgi:hypothetical protein